MGGEFEIFLCPRYREKDRNFSKSYGMGDARAIYIEGGEIGISPSPRAWEVPDRST